MKIFYIRHLQTEWNQQGLLQGSKDIPVLPPSGNSRDEIQSNLELLNNHDFDNILVSDLKRTQQTAACYGFDQFAIEPLINEFNFGEFEGQSKKKILEKHEDEWLNNVYEIKFGDDIYLLEKRVKSFISKYKNKEKILVFGHGMVGRAIEAIITDGNLKTMNQFHIINNSIKIFQIESTYRS